MRTAYNNLDINLSIDGYSIHVLNIIREKLNRVIPSHSHGNDCYEIHYISSGYGQLQSENGTYSIIPNTLYITGPHIEHAQSPFSADPMTEYCVYLKVRKSSSAKNKESIIDILTGAPFWFGQDTQGISGLLLQLFEELENQYTGYITQTELLLSQLLICLIRNCEKYRESGRHFSSRNLSDTKSVIIEDYFLYEYQSLSLQTLAERLKLSMRQTQRILKEYYGKNFQQKKAEARMSASAIYLQNDTLSIADIAETLGYSSAEHFSSAFRNYYGVSPREYRKKNLHV